MAITHLTDLHTHYDETVYEGKRRETLLAQREAGVCGIVNSGSDLPSSQRSIDLAAEYDFVWASVGVFPLSAYTVPEGCYFMMGDNRNNSEDSRYWVNTFVEKEDLLGKVVFRYYPSLDLISSNETD